MLCYAPSGAASGETRAALTPASAATFVQLGLAVHAAPGVGLAAGHADDEYRAAGVVLRDDEDAALAEADLVIRTGKPTAESVARMKRGAVHVSFLDPFNEPELLASFAAAGVSAVSLEMIPRTTLAQKMDALSSQASLAGYVAVIQAAARLGRILPMMMTPAGTLMHRVWVGWVDRGGCGGFAGDRDGEAVGGAGGGV